MKKLLMLALAAALFLSACDEQPDRDESSARQSKVMGYAGGGQGSMMKDEGRVAAIAPAMDNYAAPSPAMPPSSMVLDRAQMGDRKIAETHNLQIETEFDQLQVRYQADFKKCVALGCQILNSNIALESGGNISARIDPTKLGAFLDFLAEGAGEIKNHSVSADDYTMEYSDVATTTQNQIALRDRMSTLLQRAEKVEDILRIEQELTRIQTQIDQGTARLKILQKMTQMATINLNYSVQYRPTEVKPYELKNTFKYATQKFLMGIDRMVQFIGATLPWIPVIFIGFWLAIRMARLAFTKVTWRWPGKKG